MASYSGSAYIRGSTLYYSFTGSGNSYQTCCGIWVDKTSEQARTSTSGRIATWGYKNYGSAFPNNGSTSGSTTISRGSNHNIIVCAGVGSYRGVYDSGHRAYTHTCNVDIYWRSITFDANGGSGGSTVGNYPGEEFYAPTPTRTNYIFNGWYRNGTYYCGGGSKISMPNESFTLTASWTLNVYSFNLNILMPDGSEPYQTGRAGSIEMSVNGGAWTRLYNEPASQYTAGTVIKFRNFIPGNGLWLSGYSGVSKSGSEYSVTINSATTVNFSTSWNDTRIKSGGSWYVGDTYIKMNGSWKRAAGVYIKVNGSWKNIHG